MEHMQGTLTADALFEVAKQVSERLDLPMSLDKAASVLGITKNNLYVRMHRRGVRPVWTKTIRNSQLSELK